MEIIKNEQDFSTSVERALDEIDQKWRDYPGVLVLGTHVPLDVELKMINIERARMNGIPFLGICFGMQLMVMEFARNALKMEKATSEELGPGIHIITKLPRLHVGLDKVGGWWGTTDESHWHNYSFNMQYKSKFLDYFDISESDGIAEIMRLKSHPFFVGVQFHPEYNSFKDKPHPVLKDFVEACKNKI